MIKSQNLTYLINPDTMDLSRALINPLYPDQMGFSMAHLVDIEHFEGVFRRVHLKHTFGSSCTFSSSGGGGRNPGPPKGNPEVAKIICFLKLYLSYSDTVSTHQTFQLFG